MFLRDHCPEVLDALRDDLAPITLNCHCDCLAELDAFDDIIVRMSLGNVVQNRLLLEFEHWGQRNRARNRWSRAAIGNSP